MAAMILSSSCPAAPTNGSPTRSSSAPGASPTKQRSASSGPTPNTVCVASRRARGSGRRPPPDPRGRSIRATARRGCRPGPAPGRRTATGTPAWRHRRRGLRATPRPWAATRRRPRRPSSRVCNWRAKSSGVMPSLSAGGGPKPRGSYFASYTTLPPTTVSATLADGMSSFFFGSRTSPVRTTKSANLPRPGCRARPPGTRRRRCRRVYAVDGFGDGDLLLGEPAAGMLAVERPAVDGRVEAREWVERGDRPVRAEGQRRPGVEEHRKA